MFLEEDNLPGDDMQTTGDEPAVEEEGEEEDEDKLDEDEDEKEEEEGEEVA